LNLHGQPQNEPYQSESSESAHADDEPMRNDSLAGTKPRYESDSEDDSEEDSEEGQSPTYSGSPSARQDTSASDKTSQANPRHHQSTMTLAEDGIYTGETYGSNVFKLQADKLLEQTKVDYGQLEKSLRTLLGQLKDIIEQIPECRPLSVCPLVQYLELCISFCLPDV
jgi:hypothetical protein